MSDNSHITETITPADQSAVADAVRSAAARGLAVYPIGGGTRLDYGVKPTRPGVALSLANLNRVIDHPAADLTITVEAGITVAELSKHVTAQRQRLSVDIPQADRATVGGAIAVGEAGPRRYAYGTLRDYLLGFTAVDGTGTVFSGGGRVVKNAAGYNMPRMMVGSLGTLGIVTQVTLMVRPVPEASVFLVCEVPDFNVAERLLADLVASPTRPAAIEFVAGRPSEYDLVLGPVLAGNVGRLYVGFEGAAAEVDWMVEQLRSQWAIDGAAAPMLVPNARAEALWHQLAEFPADVQINVLPAAVVKAVAQSLDAHPDCTIHAHAGDGVIGIKLGDGGERSVEGKNGRDRGLGTSVPSGAVVPSGAAVGNGPGLLEHGSAFTGKDISKSDLPSIVSRLRRVAAASDGKLTVQRNSDGAALNAADVWGPPGPEFRLMQAIKERFDPQNILNPGRFVY
jgi:glycolate oxidase FAD binding subunit